MATVAPSRKRKVVLPAYTCYSVPAAVLRAGLEPVFCDIDPTTLSPDPDYLGSLNPDEVLAVISANLYGIPNDLEHMETAASERGILFLDDAAQALGAKLNGRYVGTFGDAGLYSFDKGKNIATIQGGAILASNIRLAKAIEDVHSRLPAPTLADTTINCAKLALYSVLLRPGFYGMIQSLPFLGLGKTIYDDTFPISKFSNLLAGVALRLHSRLVQIQEARSDNANRLRRALDGISGVEFISSLPGAEPAWLRFPIRINRPIARERTLEALDAIGIGATGSYPQSLPAVDELRMLGHSASDFPGAAEVAASIVTLPTHPYCPPGMSERVRQVVTSHMQADG